MKSRIMFRNNNQNSPWSHLKKVYQNILEKSNIEELVAFSKTLSNWKVEIINSFCISKAEYNVSKDTGEITVEQKKNQQCTDGES